MLKSGATAVKVIKGHIEFAPSAGAGPTPGRSVSGLVGKGTGRGRPVSKRRKNRSVSF